MDRYHEFTGNRDLVRFSSGSMEPLHLEPFEFIESGGVVGPSVCKSEEGRRFVFNPVTGELTILNNARETLEPTDQDRANFLLQLRAELGLAQDADYLEIAKACIERPFKQKEERLTSHRDASPTRQHAIEEAVLRVRGHAERWLRALEAHQKSAQ